MAVRAPEDFGDAGLLGAGVSVKFGFDFGVGFAVAGGGEVDGVGVLVVSTFVAVGVLVAENPAFDTGSAPGLKSARPTSKLPITRRPKHTPKKVVFQRDALRVSFDRRPSAMYEPGRGAQAVWRPIQSSHRIPLTRYICPGPGRHSEPIQYPFAAVARSTGSQKLRIDMSIRAKLVVQSGLGLGEIAN